MAWLQNLAGRAEDLLNKIDQNAATVLNEGNKQLDSEEAFTPTDIYIENEETQALTIKPSRSSNSLNLKANNNSLNLLSRSKQSSPYKELLLPVEATKQYDSETIAYDILELETNQKASNIAGNSNISENLGDKLIKGDHMSTSSHHSSFTINQELDSLHEKLARFEMENEELHKQLLNLQHLYSEVRNENVNCQLQLERANEQLTNAQKEKDQYVARAQRILQEKEKLISLKSREQTSDVEADNIFVTYNEEMKKELEFQQEKNHELNEKLSKLMSEMHSLQVQHRIIQNGLNQANQSLEQSLQNEKKIRVTTEEECLQKSKELQLKHQELAHLQEVFSAQQKEIKQLQGSIKQKQSSTVGDDLEYRINKLTHTLMVKQNTLETITTERNALRLQLEKLESEHKQKIAQLKRERMNVVHIQDVNEEKITVPHFMRVSPFDAGVTKRVKNAYSTLDAISVRTGIFLRRYPVARVFVLSYMVLLHVWVLFILVIYAPSNR